jgi:O-methyltransferase
MSNRLIDGALRRLRRGRRAPSPPPVHPDLDMKGIPPGDREVIERALPYTMTGVPRLHALVIAVRHIVGAEIPGALAECGVWRGGSMAAVIATLQQLGADDRDLYLFDTFEGMTEPGERDTSPIDGRAVDLWEQAEGRPWPEFFSPELFNVDAVREVVLSTGYPEARVHLVAGPVEETLPAQAPDSLALMRLDTDWYESTRHELEHLYPRLVRGGVLIVDDYGHWEGCQRAVDEYFAGEAEPILLSRIDYSARIGVKR